MATSSLELLARSWRPLHRSFSVLHAKSLTGRCTSHSRPGISSSCKKALCMPLRTVTAASVVAVETPSASSLPAESATTWRASLDFKWIRENRDAVALNIQNRNTIADVDLVVQLYDKSMALTLEVEKLRTDRNRVANAMKGKLEPEKRRELIDEGKRLKEVLAGLEAELTVLSEQLQREGQKIPNVTHPSVAVGSEDAATIRKVVGSKRVFEFQPKNHVELGESLDLLDFEAAAEFLLRFLQLRLFGSMAASAPVLDTTQDAPIPVSWTYELTEEDEAEMQTVIEHFSGRTLVGRLVGTTPSRPAVRAWIESALGGSIVRILELSMMGSG
ncbi:hypothetical protein L7F22_046228 [Adiantum nelumboides]|nr:hypothetical protein [Adiantum nelumboides]